jgi:TonB family protein
VISTAADVWQLGMTLVEALTQHLPAWDRARPSAPEVPAAVPEPFREIAGHCLQVEAGKRWTIAEIVDRLQTERSGPAPTSALAEKIASAPAIASQQKAASKWPYFLGLAAVVAVAVFFIARPKPSGPPAEVQSTQAQQGAAADNSRPAQVPTRPERKSSPTTPGEVGGDEEAPTKTDNQSGIVQRVMPQVSASAHRTIQGKIKVRVKVDVDAAGNVAKAKLESAGPSKYFSRVALEAASGWKFSPAQAGESGAREWNLQFAFSRARTDVSAVQVKR